MSTQSIGWWERLQKHKVAQWTLAYGAAAYTLLHVVEMVSGALDWPHIVVRLVTLLLLLGLPVATTLAWFHGHRAQHRVSGPELAVLTLLLVLAAGVLWYLGRPRHERGAATATTQAPSASGTDSAAVQQPPERSIAVLPFVDMSEKRDQEYFSDGLSEELLNLLSKTPELRVAARTSSFYFKGKTATVAEIARALNVAHVLEGSVRKSGNTVRITAQLIRADSGYHLWSETYDRDLTDILRLQDDIAAAVVRQLKGTLLRPALKAQAVNPAAYSLYLQARYLRRQFTPGSLGQSVELYKKALQLTPGFAPAWAELASIYLAQGNKGLRPAAESYALAREALDHALTVDPDNALAHTILGSIAISYDSDLAAAAVHMQRALELEPENTDIIAKASMLPHVMGLENQAIEMERFVAARDPLAPNAHFNLGASYFFAGRPDEAIASIRQALALSPGLLSARSLLGIALLQKGEQAAALEAAQQEPFEAWRLIGLAVVYHGLGQSVQADSVLNQLITKYGKDWPYNIAYVYAFRNERDYAFDWLNQAVERQDSGLGEIAGNSLFANLHSDPRWLPFLRRVGRAPEQLAAIKFDVALPR